MYSLKFLTISFFLFICSSVICMQTQDLQKWHYIISIQDLKKFAGEGFLALEISEPQGSWLSTFESYRDGKNPHAENRIAFGILDVPFQEGQNFSFRVAKQNSSFSADSLFLTNTVLAGAVFRMRKVTQQEHAEIESVEAPMAKNASEHGIMQNNV